MENVAAAVAAIPPASHIAERLHLKSKLPRRIGDLTLCTQCSLDRLERVEVQTRCWSGVLCAAVMCPCPCTADSLRAAAHSVRALHARVEAQGGQCRLDIILLSHQRGHSKLQPCRNSWEYPINALRNASLRHAATELVILLDVDFLPGRGIQEQLWNEDVYHGYVRACFDLRRVIILPALEEPPDSDHTLDDFSSVQNDQVQVALHAVSAGKANVAKLLNQGNLTTFAAHSYPRGHGPTDTERWGSSMATYEVQYKVDYEPYFLCARRLVPWYDERFTGYGRNKMIHAFHVAVLDFRFWVHPEWYVIHLKHLHSPAWEATLGSDLVASERLANVKLLYEIVKAELVAFPCHTGICLSPGTCAHKSLSTKNWHKNWCSWQSRQCKTLDEQMGHWNCSDKPSSLFLQVSFKEHLQALYDLRYNFSIPILHPGAGNWPLRSKLPRLPRDITLVTVATSDRLHRLAAQCRMWKGVVCAAIYVSKNVNVKSLEAQLIELHHKVEKAGTCRLDLILLKPAKVDKKGSCLKEKRILPNPCCRARGSLSLIDLCPINSLRNAALKMAITDLVLILDVDLLPAPSLNDCFLDEQQYECLLRMAVDRIAVVVPSFEFTPSSSEIGTRDEESWVGKNDNHIYQQITTLSSGVEMRKVHSTTEKDFIFEEERCISRTERMMERGVAAIYQGLINGELGGFHMRHYPEGHGPTDFESWKENLNADDLGGTSCCQVCRSYSVNYEEGFEPFIICSRKLTPKFDERFRGYGYDKVAFFYHMQLRGFRFRVLAQSFAVDIPHAKSSDWMNTFGVDSDPLQHIRVTALYRRVKRELNLLTGESAFFNDTGQWPIHWKNDKQSAVLLRRNRQFHVSDTSKARHTSPAEEELRLAWHGTIRRLCTGHWTPSEDCKMENAVNCDKMQVPPVDRTIETPQNESRGAAIGQGDDETNYHPAMRSQIKKEFTCFSGWKVRLEAIRSKGEANNAVSSTISVNRSEEFEWDSTGWELKCNPDSLENCSVVKAYQNDPGSAVLTKNGRFLLRISMSAGSWSPQASRLAGITSGGVSVRSFLPIRAVKEVVVRYMVRFPTSFVWNKGGTLPGLWISDLMQSNFAWRRAGEGHFSLVFTGQSHTVIEQQCARVSRPFYFVPGQWHALQLAVSVVDQDAVSEAEACNDAKSSSAHTKNISSFQDGTFLQMNVSADFEQVARVNVPCKMMMPVALSSRQELRERMGLMLSCYFGGKTEDWATPEDTHVDFSQFEIWTDWS